jgi:hypothetical protein
LLDAAAPSGIAMQYLSLFLSSGLEVDVKVLVSEPKFLDVVVELGFMSDWR